MVVALGPGRFYGSSLPLPHFFPGERVDPPAPVTDPLLAWAREAHWSVGGLSSKRLRLQGRIEGSIDKIRCRARCSARAAAKSRVAGLKPKSLAALGSDDDEGDSDEDVAQKRILKPLESESEDEQEDNEGEEEALSTIAAAAKRKRARKLSDEFDRVTTLQEGEAKKQKLAVATPTRTSPRRKAAEAAAAQAAVAPARAAPRRKAAEAVLTPAAVAPPKRKAAAATSTPVAGARRTSPSMKH
ncbi:hypothetical protein ABZP36_023563 [Zizania latifolia]